MLVRYAPDLETEFDRQFAALGLGETFHGHEGMVKMQEAFGEAWGEWQILPAMVVDLADRIVVLGHINLPGNVSGLKFESELATLMTPRGGLVSREQSFLAWDKALLAAGLDPDPFTS